MVLLFVHIQVSQTKRIVLRFMITTHFNNVLVSILYHTKALWRLVLMLSVLYEIALIYILFQTVDDARQLLTHVDPGLGKPLPEKDYGGNCLIYDPENPQDPFHNFWVLYYLLRCLFYFFEFSLRK